MDVVSDRPLDGLGAVAASATTSRSGSLSITSRRPRLTIS